MAYWNSAYPCCIVTSLPPWPSQKIVHGNEYRTIFLQYRAYVDLVDSFEFYLLLWVWGLLHYTPYILNAFCQNLNHVLLLYLFVSLFNLFHVIISINNTYYRSTILRYLTLVLVRLDTNAVFGIIQYFICFHLLSFSFLSILCLIRYYY